MEILCAPITKKLQAYLGKLTTDILGSYFVSMCNRWINRYALPLAPAILYRVMNLRVYGNFSRLLSPCGEPISIKKIGFFAVQPKIWLADSLLPHFALTTSRDCPV